jgi:hypothetical protein
MICQFQELFYDDGIDEYFKDMVEKYEYKIRKTLISSNVKI